MGGGELNKENGDRASTERNRAYRYRWGGSFLAKARGRKRGSQKQVKVYCETGGAS